MEQSNLDKLKSFAHRTGREIVYTEEQYPLPSYRKIPRYKRTVYIPYNSDNNLFFVLFSDHYYKVGVHTVFCGVYFATEFSANTKLNFRKKDIIDKLNPFQPKDKIKFNDRLVDSQLVTTGNDEGAISRYFRHPVLQRLMIENLDTNMFVNFSVNETPVDFVPQLKDTSHFAIINPQEWIFDEKIIEGWFDTMQQIQSIFQKKEMYV